MDDRDIGAPRLTIVAALAANRVIGRDGGLPWHLPDDLKHFQRLTTGSPVVMGRKTFDEVGKPLPNRTNIVVTRQRDWAADGVLVSHSLDDALALAGADAAEVFIIGGAEIYALALPLAQRMVLTHVQAEVEGDTWFPQWDADAWREVSRAEHAVDERHAHAFTIIDYARR